MRRKRLLILVAALAAAAAVAAGLVAAADPAPVGPPTATGTGGAAASVERLATQAAIDTLRKGGNATDAAVTAAAVLGVTEPFSSGIGGGGFMLILDKNAKKPVTLDGRETAPAAMTTTSFWENGSPLPFSSARYSGLSVGVPGTLLTWERALKEHGTISLAEALQPAIGVARDGFVVDETFASQVAGNVDFFNDIPASAALWLDPDGTPPDVGSVFKNPDLARTYELIAKKGHKALYRNELAQAIVDTVTNPQVAPDANHVWRPGVMTMDDLRGYKAPQRAATHINYRGLDVFGMGPPSSGGSTVGEVLNILEGYDLGGMTRDAALHYYLEASRYAYADRGAYLGDSDFVDVPLRGLLSEEFAATRRALITPQAASPPVVGAGDPWPFNDKPGKGTNAVTVTSTLPGTTTHLTVSDKKGSVVSYTFTIESTGGSGLTVPGYGFLLNNELTDFDYSSLTLPNRVEGGKRPRSSMAPTIILKNRKPFLAVGSPGGSTIITTVLQILVDRLDLGLTLPEAIADPRASQRNGSTTSAEPAFLTSSEATALRLRGHVFSNGGEIGAATGIEFAADGSVIAAAEPVRRGTGSAMVENP